MLFSHRGPSKSFCQDQMKPIVITFATKKYLNAARFQGLLCNLFGVEHVIYTPTSLPDDLLLYCSRNSRGFGFWRWKPFIILDSLNKYYVDYRVVYMDSTVLPMPSFFKSLSDLFFVPINLFSDPRSWCKPLPVEGSKMIDFLINGNVPDASVLSFVPSEYSLSLIKAWKALCDDHDYLSDSIDYSPSVKYAYVDHRHDQSLLGYICNQSGIRLSASESQFGAFKPSLFHHREDLASCVSFLKFFPKFAVFSFCYIFRVNIKCVSVPKAISRIS